MKKGTKLWLYIIINILVSAATVFLVLLIWDWSHPEPVFTPLSGSISEESTPNGQENPNLPTQSPSVELIENEFQMVIRTVVGAGNLDMEYVEILNESNGAVDLTGWQLRDNDDHLFSFPTMILDKDGALIIYSKAGQNTVIELYWQSETPVWQSGETVQLLDANGDLAAAYSIP